DCNKPHSDAAPACIHCGRPNAVAPAIATPRPALVVPVTPGPPPGGLACPKCATPDVRKLPLIYREGLSSVDTRTHGVGVGAGGVAVGGARTQGMSQTVLSQGASPPVQKDTGGATVATLVIAGVLGLLFGQTHALLGWVAFAGGAFLLYRFLVGPLNLWNAVEFPKLYRRWENTFLCTRCGERFVHELEPAPAAAPIGARPAFG
ncbi:MAG TPA: hypothetical protein VF705_08730, partial [Longimicrobium sp.]